METVESAPENTYETEKLLNEYLLFHYGKANELLPYPGGPTEALDFPLRCVNQCLDTEILSSQARALDVGCAVGRSSFELARHCAEVIGIDYSQSFVDAGAALAQEGQLAYSFIEEGEITQAAVAEIDPAIDRSRISFERGDAQALRDDLGTFDVVLACNLICRLPSPLSFLNRLPTLVKPGGQLIITTPFTWLEDYTPQENWLGGTASKGESFNGLKEVLTPNFALKEAKDLPFLIREHRRKFQWSVAQASIWKRNS